MAVDKEKGKGEKDRGKKDTLSNTKNTLKFFLSILWNKTSNGYKIHIESSDLFIANTPSALLILEMALIRKV